jgi:hypothetical protein
VFWVVLSRIWPAWREALHLVKVDTVVSWQRKAFRIYWTRISQREVGFGRSGGFRPCVATVEVAGEHPNRVSSLQRSETTSSISRLSS